MTLTEARVRVHHPTGRTGSVHGSASRHARALVAVALLIAGCGTSTPSGSGGASGTAATSGTAAPGASGPLTAAKLTIAVPDDPGSLDLWTSNQAFDLLVDLVYDKLMTVAVRESAATCAGPVRDPIDPTTWEVNIRSGVTWQDGQPFTAEDVKFTYEYFRDGVPNRYTHHTNDAPKIDAIDLVGRDTVRFHCAYPCPELGQVTFADLPILPEHLWSGVTEPAKSTGLPIGTGPYQLTEYVPGQYLRFTANKAYFGGKPTVDSFW